MIASVHGSALAVRLDAVTIGVGGVGIRILVTPATASTIRVGDDVTLATSLVVREDSLTLFGFGSEDERDVFEQVQTVSGVGPRLALAMLAVHTPDALRRAVAGEDLTALQRVPGIGKKGAQRLVLELAGKLGDGAAGDQPDAGGPPPATADVTAALVGLGWPQRAAEQAITAVLADGIEPGDAAQVLRAALKRLGGAGRG